MQPNAIPVPNPQLQTSKFDPGYTDEALKYVRGQIWLGMPRDRKGLVADCLTKDWADNLANAFNSLPTVQVELRQANQDLEAMKEALPRVLGKVAESLEGLSQDLEVTDPQTATEIQKVAATVRTEAANLGFNL